MARTYRCKNYEDTRGNSWDRAGRKVNGFYTQKTWNCYFEDVFSVPTKRELFEMKHWAHGESSTKNSRSPNKYHRLNRMRQNRMINKTEIFRFIKDENYEPMTEADPRNCWWDWS